MVSGLSGAILGLISGLLPDLVKLFTRAQENKSELALLEAQQEFELGKAQFDLQREELDYQRMQEQNKHAMLIAEREAESKQNIAHYDLLASDEREYTKQREAMMAAIPTVANPRINAFNAIIRPLLATLCIIVALGSISWYMFELASLGLASKDLLFALTQFWDIPLVSTVILEPLGFLFTSRQVRKRSNL